MEKIESAQCVNSFVLFCFVILTTYERSDIDECSTDGHTCDVNARCQNTYGSYNCSCKKGYRGDGRSCSGTFWLFLKLTRGSVFVLNLPMCITCLSRLSFVFT